MKNIIAAFFLVFTIGLFAEPTIIYVKQGGSTTADGLSWDNAVTLLRGRSLVNYYKNQTPSVETQIWAKAGTYNLTTDALQVTIPIKIYGGFVGTETLLSQRNWKLNQSIITQTVTDKGVLFSNVENDVLLDGVILQNGNKSTAGGCGSLYPGITLRNCIIRNNTTTSSAVFLLNGVLNSTRKFVFDNCLIVNNESSGEPLVFQITANAQVDIINCTIANNLANSATSGNIVGINSATGVVVNVENTLFYANRTGNPLANIISPINATKYLYNNAWDVVATSGTQANNVLIKATPFVSTSPYVGISNGTTKLLSALTGADFSLKASSGCVNAGNNAYATASSDIAGNSRIQNTTSDIGCYESEYTSYPTITADDVLSVRDTIYYLDGSPFAEIGWNKFDINWMFWDEINAGRQLTETNEMVVNQKSAIKELADAGVKTIRLFGCVHENKFDAWLAAYNDTITHEKSWLPLDKTLDICEKYNIRAIVSLMCENFVDKTSTDNLRELVGDSTSASRQMLYKYIDEAITRYKDRKGVLAWEISNEMTNKCDILPGTRVNSEGERLPTMAQLAQFYKQVGRRIKSIDPLRIVTSGGSYIREMAYGLSIIPMTTTTTAWPTYRDTYTQYKNMYKLVYDDSQFSNVDIHFYMRKAPNYQIRANDGSDFMMNEVRFNTMSRAIGKPLMLGEYGALPKVRTNTDYWLTGHDWFETFEGESDSAQMYVQEACDRAVNSGCRLIYWWCYDSFRPQDLTDPQRMDLDVDRTPILFQKVLDANVRLKQKFNISTITAATKSEESKKKLYLSGKTLYCDEDLVGKSITIFNSQGQKITSFLARNQNELNLPKGIVYLIKVDDQVLKLVNI